VPVIVMLLALIFRGVAFEFRTIAETSRKYWNVAFAGGSTLATFAQGMILGGLIQGIRVENGAFAGGPFDWFTSFALICGCGLVAGYALLGATWLVLKTEGTLAAEARARAKGLILVVLAFMAAVSVWTPLAFPRIAERWFSLPNILYLWPVPLVTALVAFTAWRALVRGGERLPFFATIALFLLGYVGLAISSYPYLVPPALTVFDAAAAPASQLFLLIGTAIMLPIILCYYGVIYWIFRGKLRPNEGYH
jgi:cytochrome d ubiquinol oxidase subunit II